MIAPRHAWPTFRNLVRRRLGAGAREHGTSSHRPLPEKLDQIAEELAGVCGWSAVAFARVEALKARAEILEATHRPTPVAAGPIELQAFGVDPTTAGVLPGCPDPSDRAGGRDEVRRRHAGRSTGARSEVWPMTPGGIVLAQPCADAEEARRGGTRRGAGPGASRARPRHAAGGRVDRGPVRRSRVGIGRDGAGRSCLGTVQRVSMISGPKGCAQGGAALSIGADQAYIQAMSGVTPLFALRLDAKDRALLAALARSEEDTMSNVVRRLVRERCKRRGITLGPKRTTTERARP